MEGRYGYGRMVEVLEGGGFGPSGERGEEVGAEWTMESVGGSDGTDADGRAR